MSFVRSSDVFSNLTAALDVVSIRARGGRAGEDLLAQARRTLAGVLTSKDALAGQRFTKDSLELVSNSVMRALLQEATQAAFDVQTPVWTAENRFASGGATRTVRLRGVEGNVLSAGSIRVDGKGPFAPGHGPDDAHTTATQNHDAFDQAVLFHGYQSLEHKFDSLDLGATFAEVVAAKSGKDKLVGHANALSILNAYYQRDSEETFYGTNSGKWDLASDKDVAVHEAGHFVLDHRAPSVFGGIHEGYGDAQASLMHRDPGLSEDFGQFRGGVGQPLRDANNTSKVSNTSAEVHDRGKVYAGVMWEIGEYLHERFTGAPRDRAVDAQLLDAQAADEALRILWTFPLYLGSGSIDGNRYITAIQRAIDSLKAAGKLDARVDAEALKQFVVEEGRRRELITGDGAVSTVESLQAKDATSAVVEALRTAGFDQTAQFKAYGRAQTGPNGERVNRYQILRPIQLRDGSQIYIPIRNQLLTLVEHKGAQFEAVLGDLPAIAREDVAGAPAPATGFAAKSTFSASAIASAFGSLKQSALSDLRSLTSKSQELVASAAMDARELEITRHPELAGKALQRLGGKGVEPRLVWQDGGPAVELNLGTLIYVAPLLADGSLGEAKRESGVLF